MIFWHSSDLQIAFPKLNCICWGQNLFDMAFVRSSWIPIEVKVKSHLSYSYLFECLTRKYDYFYDVHLQKPCRISSPSARWATVNFSWITVFGKTFLSTYS